MGTTITEGQGVLKPHQSIAEAIYAANGVVLVEDLVWPNFDPKRTATLPEYLGEIGVRMADTSRQSSTTDEALGVYGRDFARAEPRNLLNGLYKPYKRGVRPRKPFINPTTWYTTLDPNLFPGLQSPSTAVAVNEDTYNLIINSPAGQSDRIANRTERANSNGNVEGAEDLGGESAFYALTDRHIDLEEEIIGLLEERRVLQAVRRNSLAPRPKRIVNIEPYRVSALASIQNMVRVACKGLGYGTNDTKNTMLAVASNIHRSPLRAKWIADYALMAVNYNDAVRGKLDQTVHGILDDMVVRVPHLINNIDREYSD